MGKDQVDSTNLYQYVFNNPFSYTDPDGRFVFTLTFVIGTAICWSEVATTAAIATATVAAFYGGYKVAEYYSS